MSSFDDPPAGFEKSVKYGIALWNVGRLDEASVFAEEVRELARHLRELGWPDADAWYVSTKDLVASIRELKDSKR